MYWPSYFELIITVKEDSLQVGLRNVKIQSLLLIFTLNTIYLLRVPVRNLKRYEEVKKKVKSRDSGLPLQKKKDVQNFIRNYFERLELVD